MTDLKRSEAYPLRRRAVVSRLLEDRGDMLVVAGLGACAWDVTAVGDSPLNFPLWGAMGGAAIMGLGLAMAQPQRRVMVITGDGDMLMGLGSLATIATKMPGNLTVVVLDNERYGETGMQATHTAHGVDLAAVATGCGLTQVSTIADDVALEAALPSLRRGNGPIFSVIKVRAENLPFVLPPKDGAHLKDRFRSSLLSSAG